MSIFATYYGKPETDFTLVHKGALVKFPYKIPVEVDAEAARYLKSLLKPGTEDPKFRFTGTKEKAE